MNCFRKAVRTCCLLRQRIVNWCHQLRWQHNALMFPSWQLTMSCKPLLASSRVPMASLGGSTIWQSWANRKAVGPGVVGLMLLELGCSIQNWRYMLNKSGTNLQPFTKDIQWFVFPKQHCPMQSVTWAPLVVMLMLNQTMLQDMASINQAGRIQPHMIKTQMAQSIIAEKPKSCTAQDVHWVLLQEWFLRGMVSKVNPGGWTPWRGDCTPNVSNARVEFDESQLLAKSEITVCSNLCWSQNQQFKKDGMIMLVNHVDHWDEAYDYDHWSRHIWLSY